MKTKLLLALLFCCGFFSSWGYIPLTVTSGFNADVIANGVGTALTTTTGDVDGVNYCYVSNGWQQTASSTPCSTGLPATGLINSAVTAGLTYQLAGYSANNDLRIPTNTAGTLVFQTALAAQTVYILAVTGSGSSTMDVQINFTDATTQTATGITVADWYGGSSIALNGFQRLNRTTNALDGSSTGPNLYQYSVAISAANQSKLIASIQFTRTSGTGATTLNIFAVSIQETVSVSCPVPTALTATPTATTASLNWTQTGAASQWQIKYGPPGFNPVTAGTAIITATRPYILNPPLATLTSYDYYVRAICGAGDTSAWSVVKNFSTLCAAPSLLSTKDSNRCGPGEVVLQATAQAGATIKWYSAATGGTLLGTGNSFTTPTLTSTTTYYAAASAGSGGVTNGNIATITGGTNGCGGGVMFNITPTVDIVVDSFLNLSNAAQTTTVTVYYKTGTYVGSELNAAAWTTLGTTTITTIASTMALIKVPGQSIAMTAGTTYGIFIANMSTGYTDGTGPNQVYTNADLTLNAGAGLCGVWTSTVNSPRVFNGTVYYHKGSACESARTPVVATIKPVPVVNIGNDTTICPGVSYTMNATTAGATYAWNTGATTPTLTVNAAGTYSVLVTLNGCGGSDARIISPGVVPVNNLPATTNLCSGDVATLNAGNTGSTYLWTPGSATTQTINVSAGGNHSVVVKSSTNCKITSTTNVIIRPLPVAPLGNDTSICEGATITLSAGNPGYAYLWNTGATTQVISASDSGTYEVTITSPYDCELTDDKHIAFLPLPRTEGFNFIPLFYEELGKVKFSPLNPTNVNSYEWDFGDGSPHATQVNPVHIYAGTGAFIVTLKVFNGCGNTSLSLPINVNLTTGIVTLGKDDANVTIYPNPSNSVVTIDNKSKDVKMESVMVFNTLGALVYQHKADSDYQHRFAVDQFASGLYSVRILTDKGFIIRKFEVIR